MHDIWSGIDNNGMQCVLNRPGKLPNPCEEGANYDDCFEIEWYVRGQSTLFDICDSMWQNLILIA